MSLLKDSSQRKRLSFKSESVVMIYSPAGTSQLRITSKPFSSLSGIFKVVDLDYFRKNVTGSMSSSNQFLQKPSDYLASFSLSYVNASSQNVFLLQKDVNYIQEFNPNPSTTGSPRFYSSFDIDNFMYSI